MSQIQNTTDAASLAEQLQQLLNLTDTTEVALKELQSKTNTSELPPDIKEAMEKLQKQFADLPQLKEPGMYAGNTVLDLEILIKAIGDQVRQSETKSGIASIKANTQQMEIKNQEKLEKVQEQLEKTKNASIWDKIATVFKAIAAVATLIAGAVMIATGVGSIGGAAMIAVGISLADNLLNTIGEMTTGHGFGISGFIAWGVGAISGSEEAESWTRLGLGLAIGIGCAIVTCGAGAASQADKIAKIATIVQKAAAITQTTAGAAGAVSSAVSAVYTYEGSKAVAEQKRLEAILENMNMMNELINKHLKAVLEDSQNVANSVKEIIDNNVEAQTAIITGGGGAAMA
ncbi:MAG: hypothetical protein IJS54_06030 [Desulfovibrio sp.]|nr:hypothetical protein [Desulfovibrio sp.]